jgi:hypothetical protein
MRNTASGFCTQVRRPRFLCPLSRVPYCHLHGSDSLVLTQYARMQSSTASPPIPVKANFDLTFASEAAAPPPAREDSVAGLCSDVDEAFPRPLSVALADAIVELLSGAFVDSAPAETVADLVEATGCSISPEGELKKSVLDEIRALTHGGLHTSDRCRSLCTI